jgi:hypothetical protein
MIEAHVEGFHARAAGLWVPHHVSRRRRRQPGDGRRRREGSGLTLSLHVRDLPLYDHRERPSTRLGPPEEEEYEEEG